MVLITLNYTIATLTYTDYIYERLLDSFEDSQYHIFYIMWNTLRNTLGPICHWIYASQYLKTCFLTSGIVEKAVLIHERHQTVIEDQYLQKTMSYTHFISSHDAIDADI